MTGYRISQLAQRTGFRASTLRYYEQVGLLATQRTPNGYRAYGEADVARLRFIARAKQLGLPLDDIRELVGIWDGGLCASVKARLGVSLAARSRDVAQRIDELSAFEAELRRARAALDEPAPGGACDDHCGCVTSQAGPVEVGMPNLSGLSAVRGDADESVIACGLNGAEQSRRVGEWAALLAAATGRQRLGDGMRVTFPSDPVLAGQLAELAAREQQCCGFFTFTVEIAAGGAVTMDVRAPSNAQRLVTELFGQA